MKYVFPDRIIHISEDSPETFRFRVAKNFSSSKIEVRDLASFSPEIELKTVLEIIEQSRINPERKIHIQGISLSVSIEEIRKLFETFDCFDALRNRYSPNFQTVPLTFGANVSDTGVFGSAPKRGSGNAKAVRVALNCGLLSYLRIDSVPKRGTKKAPKPEEALAGLLSNGAISPFVLGRILGYNAFDRGLIEEWEYLDITRGSRS